MNQNIAYKVILNKYCSLKNFPSKNYCIHSLQNKIILYQIRNKLFSSNTQGCLDFMKVQDDFFSNFSSYIRGRLVIKVLFWRLYGTYVKFHFAMEIANDKLQNLTNQFYKLKHWQKRGLYVKTYPGIIRRIEFSHFSQRYITEGTYLADSSSCILRDETTTELTSKH